MRGAGEAPVKTATSRNFALISTIWALGFGLSIFCFPAPGLALDLTDILHKKGIITEEEHRQLQSVKDKEKGLVELLRKKGIVSEEEYRQVVSSKQKKEKASKADKKEFEVVYKDGFRLRKGKDFELRTGVQIFNQYSFFPNGTTENSDFRLRRARLRIGGKIKRNILYRLELEGTSDPSVKDAYMGWKKSDEFQIRFGQDKTPFGGEENWSRYKLFFLERSLISDNLTEGSSRGIYVEGDLSEDRFSYMASITTGTGDSGDDNSERDYSLRLVSRPFMGTSREDAIPLEVGGNVSIGNQPFDSRGGRTRLFLRDNRVQVFNASTEGQRLGLGGDVWFNKNYKKGPFSATAEYIWQRHEREGPTLGRGNDDLIRHGFHVQAGYLVTGTRKKNGLELVAKYELIDMDDSENNGGSDEILGQTVKSWGLGVNYWLMKEVRLSLNGFIFDIDQPIDRTSDDPFLNGDTAWAVISGAYFKF